MKNTFKSGLDEDNLIQILKEAIIAEYVAGDFYPPSHLPAV